MSLPVHTLQFDVRNEQAMKTMAILTAEWIRQGIVFTMENWDDNHIRVTLTGGY
jgi:hypothetical protein